MLVKDAEGNRHSENDDLIARGHAAGSCLAKTDYTQAADQPVNFNRLSFNDATLASVAL